MLDSTGPPSHAESGRCRTLEASRSNHYTGLNLKNQDRLLLNSVTVPDAYPIPSQDEIIQKLQGKKSMTCKVTTPSGSHTKYRHCWIDLW
jgi:hypothetical protein